MRWLEEDYEQKILSDIVQEFMMESACSQLVTENTRSEIVQGNMVSKTCIDHCYTNAPEKISKPEVISVGTSDHLGVVVTKYSKLEKSKPQTVKKRSYKDFKVENFLTEVFESKINESVTACDDLDAAAEVFEEMFREILDNHAPIKVFQMRKNYTPYLSEETKMLMKEQKVLKEEMTRNGDLTLAKELKHISKEISKNINRDEKDYFENGMSDKVDVSTAWKTANELLGIKKNLAPTAITEVGNNGMTETIRNPQNLANLFNKFFRNKVRKLRAKSNHQPTVQPTERLRSWLGSRSQPPPHFTLKEIDVKTLRVIMKRMKCKRVHGVDWIDSYSLKIASPLMEDSLLHLVNLSIRQSKFAKNWKPQLVHPFHKKKAKDQVENYRPVSHLVQVGKIAEYAVNFQIIEHFHKHNLFHPNHHGSLAGHSTATAVIQIFDLCLEAAEHHELSAACLLDQSAAYDLLRHQLFSEKLRIYNFDESSISWVMSYLSGRYQQVVVESKISSPILCEDDGVPQGSVLGGLFHVINSNDFPACHQEGEAVVYVDDDSDIVHDEDPERLKLKIQQEAENSASWLSDNGLCVAGDKSKLLAIGTRQRRNQKLSNKMSIHIDGKEIIESDSEKLLGVVINNELTWKNHLHGDDSNEGLISQLSRRIGIMKRLSTRMSQQRLKLFASGIFYSKLSYCLPVFGNVFGLDKYKETNTKYTSFTTSDNNKLQVLQNSLNRLLTRAEYNTPTLELLRRTDSLSVQQMIAFQTIVMTHKIMKSQKPTYLAKKLQVRHDGRNLRGYSGGVQSSNHSISIVKEGFLYRGSTLVNMLPISLRVEDDLDHFKADLREWVKVNIAAKPKSKFPNLGRAATWPPPAPPPPQPPPNARMNLITQYFQAL